MHQNKSIRFTNYKPILLLIQMKKTITAVVVAMCSLSANAQLWVGGGVGFSRFENNSEVENTIGDSGNTPVRLFFGPKVGYNLNDKWAIALALDYSHWNSHDESNSYTNASYLSTKSKGNSFSVTPFVRYTFAKSGIVSFYVDGGISLGFSKSNTDEWAQNEDGYVRTDEMENSTNSCDVGLRPGMLIELSDHVGLELNLGFFGYTYRKRVYDRESDYIEYGHSKNKTTSTSNGFGFCGNSGDVNFGVIWKF